MTKKDYMHIAIEEAKKGMGYTSPNPMVGAVIVKNGRIISKDHHHKCGEFHAERNAILNCNDDMKGAEIYVTLEPCCHFGKTPPCTQAIIDSGIRKVYIGSDDPNPKVSGGGIKILRENGIEVETGILKEECDKLNEVFFHYITCKTPYVVMKYAMTADGKIASVSGKSKWISNNRSREYVQFLRHKYSAIMVGINTVLADDPLLTCRMEKGVNPIRIVCDSFLRTPLSSNLVKTAKEIPLIIACTEKAKGEKSFIDAGVKIIKTSEKNGHVNLAELMEKLHREGIDSILLEGGGQLNYTMFKEGLVNKVLGFISPKIMGGKNAPSPVSGEGFDSPQNCVNLKKPQVSVFDDDILMEWEVLNCSQE